MKQTSLSREQGLALLRKYNKEPFHILHGLTVEGVMEWYAEQLGYGDGMQESLDMGQKRSTGVLSDCCMTLILNFIRKNTASGHRSFCATEAQRKI